jgi:hypothetical protein
MAGNTPTRKAKARRRPVMILFGAAGAFAAAAAMATGSAFTAAPAKADIETLLDPIIQPFMTSLTDAIAGFDPAAATDLTSWTDSLLSGLNALDMSAALPAAAVPAAAATGPYDIPLSVALGTEPTVNVAVEGGSSLPMLVDTGSSGLVVPWHDVGPFGLGLFSLGMPTGISESGYSGGVNYLYLTYDNATVNYGDGVLTDTHTPIDVEILSWPTSFNSPLNFDQFLADDHVSGILGIGADTAGPTHSPLESYGGVLVDIPHGQMVVDSANPLSSFDAISGAPVTINPLTETVTNSVGQTLGSGSFYNDIDSGGVYGTIPSSIGSSLAPGDKISVYDESTLLYSYTVGTDSFGTSTAPTAISGIGTAGSPIDSGVEPYLQHPIYIDYANNMLYFDNLT